MKISDVGEFGLIDIIKENTLYHPENVVIGIGDDGAVYRTTPGWQQVTVIDTMVQDSHFIIGKTAYWYDVGFKSVASNLSDIAAWAPCDPGRLVDGPDPVHGRRRCRRTLSRHQGYLPGV